MNLERAEFGKPLSIVSAVADGPEFTALDRRLFNVLFFNAYPKIKSDFRQSYEVHQINLADLQHFLGHDRRAIHESLQRLWSVKITIQYQDDESGAGYTTYGHYLSYQVPDSNDGVLSYMFDKFIIRFMNFNQIYAPIELAVSNQLRNSFSHRLYEGMSAQYRKFLPVWQMTVEEARAWFEVGNNYERFDKFKAGVIEAAVEEVNKHAPFTVKVEYIKSGRGGKVVAIRFTADPQAPGELYAGRKAKPKQIAARDTDTRDMFDGMLDRDRSQPPNLQKETWKKAAEIMGPQSDLNALRDHWFEANGARSHINPDVTFLAWLKIRANVAETAAPVHSDIDVEMMFEALMKGESQ